VIIFLRETGGDHSIGDGRGLEAFGDQPDAQRELSQRDREACSGGRGRGVGGCYGHAAPVNGSSVAGAAGMRANLGSQVTSQRPTRRMHQVM
jgi:hypothetical protein